MKKIGPEDFHTIQGNSRALKAIETEYRGYKFRSRLEARWAVFFDALGIAWEYEPEGYYIGFGCIEGDRERDPVTGELPAWVEAEHAAAGGECNHRRRYLPDFRLTASRTWVEVKGAADQLDFGLLADAVDYGAGLPDIADSYGSERGLLVLGPIPQAHAHWIPCHPILQHQKGGWVGTAHFIPGSIRVYEPDLDWFDSLSTPHQGGWTSCVTKYFSGTFGMTQPSGFNVYTVSEAYRKARQARFEHGQYGARA